MIIATFRHIAPPPPGLVILIKTDCFMQWICCILPQFDDSLLHCFMLVLISSEEEGRIVEARLRALAHCLGPMVELDVSLPDGRTIRSSRGGQSPAARCASLSEWMEDRLTSGLDQSLGSR